MIAIFTLSTVISLLTLGLLQWIGYVTIHTGRVITANYDLPWLQERESQMSPDARLHSSNPSNPSIPNGFAEIRMLWQTPLLTIDLRKWGVDVAQFNSKLAACILTQYERLKEANKERLVSTQSNTSSRIALPPSLSLSLSHSYSPSNKRM